MRTSTLSLSSVRFTALAILLVAALAFVALSASLFVRSKPAPVQPAVPVQSDLEVEIRNRRLLELNDGIKPVVTAAPNERLKRLQEQRNRRLLELNEGYAPTPFRSPRDQRLYELNR